jgi:acyl carrier protein
MSSDSQQAALNVLLRTVRDAIDQYLQAPGASAGGAAATVASAVAPAAASAGAAPGFDQVKRQIVATMVEKTGYPEEMLDLDLDLETDLGIDTVKQVAVYAVARDKLGIPIDPEFKLRDHNTLRKVIAAMAKRLPGAR